MEAGEQITRALAIVAVVCYLLRVLLDVWGSKSSRLARLTRWIWTFGCLALWLHIAAAFHFFHGWSHADAVRNTAEQTEKLVGWSFGGGVYFNYVFALLWLWDVVLWWRGGEENASNSPVRFWTIHAVFAFMMLNATVVFGPVYWRYVGVAYVAILVAVRRFRPRSGNNP